MKAARCVAAGAMLCSACASLSDQTPKQRMQHDLLWLSTREFIALEATGAFAIRAESLPPRGDAPLTSVALVWTGRAGWIARASIPGHAGDCVMAGGVMPEGAFAFTTVRHKGADPEDVVCDNSLGPGTADWATYLQRYTQLSLQHAVGFFTLARGKGQPMSADSAVRPGLLAFSGLHKSVLWSDDSSWAAEAWLDAQPNRSCVTWWGRLGGHKAPVTKGGVVARPGTVVCDTPSAARDRHDALPHRANLAAARDRRVF